MYIDIFIRCTNRNQYDILITAISDVSKETTDMSHEVLVKPGMQPYPITTTPISSGSGSGIKVIMELQSM